MERAIPIDLQQIERKLLAAFERYGSDGRAITLQSLATSVGTHGNAKEFRLALKDLVGRGLVRRAGEDPIPGSAIAFRLVAPVMRGGVGKGQAWCGELVSADALRRSLLARGT